MIPWLHPSDTAFPHPSSALDEPNGLLAAGGDLSAQRLISAYRQGIFPWFSEEDPILWWSPNPRCVLFPEDIHISRSMRKWMRRSSLTFTFDQAFHRVIASCASLRQETTGTWISPEIESAYVELHKRGIAHSVEVWDEDKLVGGLYGLAMGKLFFGESMFSTQENTSKVAFMALAKQLSLWGYPLIDCQVHNPHLASLGATDIPRTQFLDYIDRYADQTNEHPWAFEFDLASLTQSFNCKAT
jgi:leucyl/phenylalanyl-tRNA--protein transferase